jgi:hypothetical protein
MLIPYFRAECRLQNKQAKKQALANRRANEAMERILGGETLRRLETKDAYGTGDGVPIREEVVSRHGNAVACHWPEQDEWPRNFLRYRATVISLQPHFPKTT